MTYYKLKDTDLYLNNELIKEGSMISLEKDDAEKLSRFLIPIVAEPQSQPQPQPNSELQPKPQPQPQIESQPKQNSKTKKKDFKK